MFNVQNYFVPEDARRSTYRINYKSREKKEAVADLIASRKPDVVGLIEMGGTEALNDLAVRPEKRGLSYQERFVLERPGEERALAVLSRLPLARNDSKANYPLYGERNRCMLRGILDVTVKAEDGRLFRIVGVHLKSKVSDDQAAADSLRRREADTLARYLHQAQRERPGLPMLVFGDFNDTPSSPAVQTVARGVNGKSAMTRLSPEDGSGTGWTLYYRNEDTYSAFDHIFINKTLSSRVKGRPPLGRSGNRAEKFSQRPPCAVVRAEVKILACGRASGLLLWARESSTEIEGNSPRYPARFPRQGDQGNGTDQARPLHSGRRLFGSLLSFAVFPDDVGSGILSGPSRKRAGLLLAEPQ